MRVGFSGSYLDIGKMRWRKSVDQLNCFKDWIIDEMGLDLILESLIAAGCLPEYEAIS